MSNRGSVVGLLFLYFCAAQAVTRDEVEAGAAQLYQERIADLQSRYLINTDPAFRARIDRITASLITEARIIYPVTNRFSWTVYVTDDPEESASCMAGGKLLISRHYVNRMALTDAELAMLLSHEIVHAALEHNLVEFELALQLEPERSTASILELQNAIDHDADLMAKLTALNQAQETEADLEGMRMAWQSGWPAQQLAGYFKKLAQSDPMRNADHDGHPASSQRWQAARKLAKELDERTIQK